MTSQTPMIRLTGASIRYRQRRSLFRHSYNEVLREIDLDVERGETLGVIGRNGCGKSTLLKLLAGIYRPDAGTLETFGNLASLLTLSAGFDPELNGYENSLLSAMLLGHPKRRVLGMLDEIFEFSELGKEIYQPLKTYSSGMKARLGFSVAMVAKPDVLLIDETLGVGDMSFRKKAETALTERIQSDQTVVLVSHSSAQILKLCDRAIWLEGGDIERSGPPAEVVGAYEAFLDARRKGTDRGSK